MLTQPQLEQLLLPVGAMTKDDVRALARDLELGTAAKPDSQDVCFIHSSVGRRGFLGDRLELHAGEIVDDVSGEVVGEVPAIEMVTVGQRRGLGVAAGQRRYALSVDVATRRVVVGNAPATVTTEIAVGSPTWVDRPLECGAHVLAQTSAHGSPAQCTWTPGSVTFDAPHALVAPGQTIAFYDWDEPDVVVGSVIVTPSPRPA